MDLRTSSSPCLAVFLPRAPARRLPRALAPFLRRGLRAASGAPPRRGGDDLRRVEVQRLQQLRPVVHDEILEREAHHGLPAVEGRQRGEGIRARVDFVLDRLHVAQVEAGVVVLEPVAPLARGLARRRILPVVGLDEPRLLQLDERGGKLSAAFHPERRREFRHRHRRACERAKRLAGKARLPRDDVGEHLVEVGPEQAVRAERHAPDVLRRGNPRIDLFQIPGHAARHGEDVRDFPRVDPLRRCAPELRAVRERQFADDHVERTPAEEGAIVDDVLADPPGHAPAQDDDQPVMLLPMVVPGDLDIVGEGLVIVAEPRDFVDEDHRPLPVANLPVEPDERTVPVGRRRAFRTGLRRELRRERRQLVLVPVAGLRPQPLQFDEPGLRPLREPLDQRRLADAPPSAARDEGADPLAPQAEQVVQLRFASEKLHIRRSPSVACDTTRFARSESRRKVHIISAIAFTCTFSTVIF